MRKRELESREGNAPEVPEIFRLIQDNAPRMKLVERIMADAEVDGRDGLERVYLGMAELLKRNNEGYAAIEYIADNYDGELSRLARDISQKYMCGRRLNPMELERNIGIKRYQLLFDLHDSKSDKPVFEYAKASGLIDSNMSLDDFKEYVIEDINKSEAVSGKENPHITGSLEKQVVSRSITFGVCEPAYLELLQAMEILRLRTLESPSFLLLGSLGKYSALEFNDYAKKINPRIATHIIDVNKNQRDIYKEHQRKEGRQFVIGNALQMPYSREAFDHVYTNSLLHALVTEVERSREEAFTMLMQEVASVLKSGGSLVMVENIEDFGINTQAQLDLFINFFQEMAKNSGLKLDLAFQRSPVYFFRRDASSAKISKNGFPYYKGAVFDSENTISMRFVKTA